MVKTFNFFNIFNATEFLALGIPSRTITPDLIGYGPTEILIVHGIALGIVIDGIFLSLNLNGVDPFYYEGYCIRIDDNSDVWVGIEVQDED